VVLHLDCEIEPTPEHQVDSVRAVRRLEDDRPKREIEGRLEPECQAEVNAGLRRQGPGNVKLGAELLGEGVKTGLKPLVHAD
jgi:hypothetical protein